MIDRIPTFFLILLLIITSEFLAAQTSLAPLVNKTYGNRTHHIYEDFSERMGKAARVFNGPEYVHSDSEIGGHPFLGQKSFLSGSVIYDGERYDKLDISYDIYRDELVIAHNNQDNEFSMIKAPKSMVQGFSIGKRQFIRLNQDPVFASLPGEGYYELLYNKNLKVWVKRRKKTQPSSDKVHRYTFRRADFIYVENENIFHHIRSKSSLLKVLEDEKKSIKKFVKEEGIGGMELDDYTANVCAYYDQMQEN